MIPTVSVLDNDNGAASWKKKVSVVMESQIPISNYINIVLFSDQIVYSFICLLP